MAEHFFAQKTFVTFTVKRMLLLTQSMVWFYKVISHIVTVLQMRQLWRQGSVFSFTVRMSLHTSMSWVLECHRAFRHSCPARNKRFDPFLVMIFLFIWVFCLQTTVHSGLQARNTGEHWVQNKNTTKCALIYCRVLTIHAKSVSTSRSEIQI